MKVKKSIGSYFLSSIIILSFSVFLLNAAITVVNAYRQYRIQSARITSNYVEQQESIVKYEVEKAIEDINFRNNFGTGSVETQREKIIKWLSEIRFPNRGINPGFFFIRELDGISIMSVSKPELVGRDLSDMEGPDGIVTHRLFMNVLEDGKGEGFADYSWYNPDTDRVEKKRSFIKIIPDWNAYLGAGFWFNDIQGVIDLKKSEILHDMQTQFLVLIILMFLFTWSAIFLSRLFKKKMMNNFSHFVDFFQEAADSRALINIDQLEYSEFGEIAAYANEMSEKQELAENAAKQALKEKEILLRELYHRTKNNMQVIIALLNIKSEEIGDSRLELVFIEIQNKIHSMAMVHEKLYQSSNLSSIELDDYIIDLCTHLRDSYDSMGRKLNFAFELEKLLILIDFALPIGLIINELISNTLKHAYSDSEQLQFKISLKKRSNSVILEISDNGKGFPPDFDYKNSESLGIKTIVALAESQLNGTIDFNGGDGVTCRIEFTDTAYIPRV